MDNISPVNFVPNDGSKKKTKNKSFLIMKAAMSLIRNKSDGKQIICKPPPPPPAFSQGVLNQILGSVRPLHISDNLFPASPNHPSSESFDSMSSPCYSSFGESSTVYGSSTSLQDLENLQVDRLPEFDVDEGGEYRYHHENSPRVNRRGLRMTRSSPFASAMDLLELGSDGESEDDDHVEEEEGDDDGGDEMIDTKADAFITQFYSKMRVHG